MGVLIKFLIDNYIYFVFVAILLILALVGYIIDSAKTEKLKKEFSEKEKETMDIPLAAWGANVKIGETVNKLAVNNMNKEETAPQTDIPPVTPKTEPEKEVQNWKGN